MLRSAGLLPNPATAPTRPDRSICDEGPVCVEGRCARHAASAYHGLAVSVATDSLSPVLRELLSVADAEVEIAACMPRSAAELIPIDNAAGRVLREKIRADRDQPAFDRVTMDGIAFAFADWQQGGFEFEVSGTQAAGRAPLERTRSRQCFEVMTGAALPRGCDCVVPVEQIAMHEGRARLRSDVEPTRLQFVHRRGSDYREGACLLKPGSTLHAPEIAVLASAGRTEVRVARKPSIAVIATGDELVDVGAAIRAHEVRRSNDRALAAALALHGYSSVVRVHVPDDRHLLRRTLRELLEKHAVLVLSGGVSMGRFDYVPGVLAHLSVDVRFHKVRQRPGKPMWFGTGRNGQAVFALPGNPVSSLVCLYRYVLPALRRSEGRKPAVVEWIDLAEAVEFEPALAWFLPVRILDVQGSSKAVPVYTNTSGDFAALAGTDGFVELPADRRQFPAGFSAPFYRW
ncbi:MAG: molybdopterin molybdotransferase MoeA [Gammaproteobacteria bacterium]